MVIQMIFCGRSQTNAQIHLWQGEDTNPMKALTTTPHVSFKESMFFLLMIHLAMAFPTLAAVQP